MHYPIKYRIRTINANPYNALKAAMYIFLKFATRIKIYLFLVPFFRWIFLFSSNLIAMR